MTNPIIIQIQQAAQVNTTIESKEVNVLLQNKPPVNVVISPMGERGLKGDKGEKGDVVYVDNNQTPTTVNGGYF
jgi:hypothetical protein